MPQRGAALSSSAITSQRNNGHSLEVNIARINPILRDARPSTGPLCYSPPPLRWFGYFANAKANTFSTLDGWVRGRLRSILRKRHKRRGRARGRDHQRWPNAYFGSAGLFQLESAWQELRQSRV